MKIFLCSTALLCCEAVKVTSARAKTKNTVMKTKIVSLSKKPFLLRLHGRVRFGSVNMTSNDLLRAQADIEKRFPFFRR